MAQCLRDSLLYSEQNSEELFTNGYRVLKGKRLKAFINAANHSGRDINVPTKTTVLGVFDFRAFLNMAMLLSESEKARALRQLMLDIVIDLINRKTGGGTKYINQRDKDFVFSSLQEDNYRRQFTDALKNGESKEFASFDILHGSEYDGVDNANFVFTNNTLTGITDNTTIYVP